MGRLLPAGLGGTPSPESGPRVIGIDGDEADDLLAAMASATARELLAALHEEPAAASELADRVDTSLQNAQYHLGRLQDAGAVTVIDTVYSEKGREMKVYAPADEPLVVVAGGESETSSLRAAITTLLAGVGAVGVLAVLVQELASPATTDAADDVTMMSTESTTPVAAAAPAFDPASVLAEPGVLFFLGGLAAVLAVVAVSYARG